MPVWRRRPWEGAPHGQVGSGKTFSEPGHGYGVTLVCWVLVVGVVGSMRMPPLTGVMVGGSGCAIRFRQRWLG
jgi:hypothetical protein